MAEYSAAIHALLYEIISNPAHIVAEYIGLWRQALPICSGLFCDGVSHLDDDESEDSIWSTSLETFEQDHDWGDKSLAVPRIILNWDQLIDDTPPNGPWQFRLVYSFLEPDISLRGVVPSDHAIGAIYCHDRDEVNGHIANLYCGGCKCVCYDRAGKVIYDYITEEVN